MVNYGAPGALGPLLDSIAQQTERPTVRIWHNGPGPIEALRVDSSVRAPSASVEGGEGNLGFGEGVNRLLANSVAEVSIIANPDLVLERDCVGLLARALHESGAVVAGGALTTAGVPSLVNAYRQRLSFDLVGINTDRGRPMADLLAESPRASAGDFLGPSGALFAVHRTRYASAVGGLLFCRSFFLYLEDVALWIRLRRHGAGIAFEPRAQAVHAFSQSVGQRSAMKLFQVERNRLWLTRCLWGTPRALALLPFTAARYTAYLLAGLRKPRRALSPPEATNSELVRALREALAQGLGPIPAELTGYLAAGTATRLTPFFAKLGDQLKNPVA